MPLARLAQGRFRDSNQGTRSRARHKAMLGFIYIEGIGKDYITGYGPL